MGIHGLFWFQGGYCNHTNAAKFQNLQARTAQAHCRVLELVSFKCFAETDVTFTNTIANILFQSPAASGTLVPDIHETLRSHLSDIMIKMFQRSFNWQDKGQTQYARNWQTDVQTNLHWACHVDVVVVVSLGPAPPKIGATFFAYALISSGFNGKQFQSWIPPVGPNKASNHQG